jgi:hypothetical protein
LVAVCVVGCSAPAENASKTEPRPEPAADQKIPVETLKASYESTKKAFNSDGSEANKKAYVDATVAYATGVMAGEGPPREKYPGAIKLYDEALALDPKNDEAKANKQLILDIYESMGKEPPK